MEYTGHGREQNEMERLRFQDKVVIVTGGGSGIGLATVKRLAAEGARVVVADLKPESASAAAEAAKDIGAPDAWGATCDVSRVDQVESTVSGALDRWGRLDVVVNNAGLMVFKPLEEHTEEDWLRILHVDLLGAFSFTKQAFLKMQPGGAIVNVSSIHAAETTPLVSSYAAAKAALVSLSRSAAIEGKARGIRVNVILPGAVDTPCSGKTRTSRAAWKRSTKRTSESPKTSQPPSPTWPPTTRSSSRARNCG